MDDSDKMRTWLRDNGHDVGDRGRIPAHLRDAYEAHHAANPDPPDEDGGVTEADFDDSEPESPPETPPRRPRGSRQTTSDRIVGRLLGTPKSGGKAKPKRKTRLPRVSLEKFSARTWNMLGRMAAPIAPCTASCLELQAPMAGVIMDQIARDTPLDRLLQPFARYDEKIEAGFALSTPLWVLGYEMTYAMKDEEQAALRRMVLQQLIAESIRSGLQVTEKYAEELEAARERTERTNADVERIMALIFAPMMTPATVVQDKEPEMADA